jgi:ElaB/YqjD/DUF883 family membrane-anchored ribosome-binding protein
MNTARKLNQLMNETEELLAELSDRHGPDIQVLKGRLKESIEQTRDVVGKRQSQVRVKARDVAASFNDYVRDYPWVALATGVLIASTVGILSTTATKRSRDR